MRRSWFQRVLVEARTWLASIALVSLLFGAAIGVLAALSITVWIPGAAWGAVGIAGLGASMWATWLLLRPKQRWRGFAVAAAFGGVVCSVTQFYMHVAELAALSGSSPAIGLLGEVIESGPNGIAATAAAALAMPITVGAVAGTLVWIVVLASCRTSAST